MQGGSLESNSEGTRSAGGQMMASGTKERLRVLTPPAGAGTLLAGEGLQALLLQCNWHLFRTKRRMKSI